MRQLPERVRLVATSTPLWYDYTAGWGSFSPAREVDAAGLEAGSIDAYMLSLKSFKGDPLQHMSVTFMIQTNLDPTILLLLCGSYSVAANNIYILTQSLSYWITKIQVCSHIEELRRISNLLYVLLETRKIYSFKEFDRIERDGEFTLTRR